MSEAPPLLPVTPAEATPTSVGAQACPNCGHENAGEFCAACGQKRLHPGDLKLKHAWHHLVHELGHVDGKIFNSFKLLFTRPGQLTLDFLEGRRARHLHPIRLFLVIGFAFFLLAQAKPLIDFRAIFASQADSPAVSVFQRAAAKRGLTLEEMTDRLNARVAPAFKPMFIATLLFQGCALWLLFRRQRPLLAENMVTALHLACFNMSVLLILGWLPALRAHRTLTLPVIAVFSLGYFLPAARRIYDGSWPLLALKWLLLHLFGTMLFASMVLVIIIRALAAH